MNPYDGSLRTNTVTFAALIFLLLSDLVPTELPRPRAVVPVLDRCCSKYASFRPAPFQSTKFLLTSYLSDPELRSYPYGSLDSSENGIFWP